MQTYNKKRNLSTIKKMLLQQNEQCRHCDGVKYFRHNNDAIRKMIIFSLHYLANCILFLKTLLLVFWLFVGVYFFLLRKAKKNQEVHCKSEH